MSYFYLFNYAVPIAFLCLVSFLYRLHKPLAGIVSVIGLLFLFSLPFLNTSGWFDVPFKVVP